MDETLWAMLDELPFVHGRTLRIKVTHGDKHSDGGSLRTVDVVELAQ